MIVVDLLNNVIGNCYIFLGCKKRYFFEKENAEADTFYEKLVYLCQFPISGILKGIKEI